MEKITIEKGTVQETLVIPLYGRKICNEAFPELYNDPYADELIAKLDYDFSAMEKQSKSVSSMVIVSSGDERTLEQIEKQLNKKLDVIKVKTFDESESINRELLLVKIKYNRGNRRDIMDNCQILGARIVDMSRSQMMIEMCDTPERVAVFMDTLKSVSIVEITRTGVLAMTKCNEPG